MAIMLCTFNVNYLASNNGLSGAKDALDKLIGSMFCSLTQQRKDTFFKTGKILKILQFEHR